MELEQRSLHRVEKIQGKQKDTGNEWLATERKRKKKQKSMDTACNTSASQAHRHDHTHTKTDSHLLLPSGYKTSSIEAENGERMKMWMRIKEQPDRNMMERSVRGEH